MTDKIATDLSDTGGSLFRFNSPEPPAQLLTVLGIPEAADYIADVHPSTDWIGSLTIPAAEAMGCYPGTPVAVGANAVAASLLGLGAIEPEDFSVILNDECQIVVMRNKAECDPSRYWNHYLPFISENRIIEVISRFDGTSRLQWAINAFLEASERQDVDAILQNTCPGCGGVVYCSRSTQNDRYDMHLGGFFGTNASTTRKEMLRAVYESVAFAVKACYQTVSKNDHLYLTGSDLTGTVLPQIIADVVGIKVICTNHTSMATKGAAICAALSTAQYPDLQSAVTQCCTQNTVYEPHPCPIYDRLFELYKNLRKATIPLWQNRMEIGI